MLLPLPPLPNIVLPGVVLPGVTIRRDRWGIPHVRGRRDADVVRGLMYAQAEDDYAQLENDAMAAIGRAAEIEGERGLGADVRFRALGLEALAKRRLARAPHGFRSLAQGYADGLNLYLDRHPGTTSRIGRYEPWFFLANVDLPNVVDGVPTARVGRFDGPEPFRDAGSNAWALAPSRTTRGRAILFLNPHVGLFGPGLRYECVLESGEGWNFDGFCILGNPIPHAGHNRHLGWTHTNTRADAADAYRLTLDGDRYLDGARWRPIERWTERVNVLENGRLVPREVRLERTRFGPLVRRNGEAFAYRLPLDRFLEFWPQKLAMGKARNLAEFRQALAKGGLTYSNTTYADDAGHIGFWYGNTVPRRDPRLDWSRPVDARDPRAEWRGYLSPDELPHVVDPACGFVQNCNSAPWTTTGGPDDPRPEAYPAYIVRDEDTARAANLRRLLGAGTFTYDGLARLAFDARVFTAAARVPRIVAAVGSDPARSAPLRELAAWDGVATVDSVAATLYFETEQAAAENPRQGLPDDPALLRRAFLDTVARLESRFGTWRVAWGRVNRLQRVRPFGGAAPSWPVAGAPSAFGQVFAFTGPLVDGVRYGTGGNTYVGLVEFAPGTPRASAVCGFGQSADPNSPHFDDQAPYYAAGRFRPF